VAQITRWSGPDRGIGIWPSEIRLRDANVNRKNKIKKLLDKLKEKLEEKAR
jgi:hypothetical protein